MQLQFLHEIVDDFHHSRQQHSVHKQDLHQTYPCDCCGFFICQTIEIFVVPDSNTQSISETYIGHTRVTVVVSSSARPSMISVMSDTVWLELKWMRARGITRSNRRFRDSCSSWKPGWKQGWDQDDPMLSHLTLNRGCQCEWERHAAWWNAGNR